VSAPGYKGTVTEHTLTAKYSGDARYDDAKATMTVNVKAGP
jgi:hypothetical protein